MLAPRERIFRTLPEKFSKADLERVESLKPGMVFRVRTQEERGVLVITGLTRATSEIPAWIKDGCIICKISGDYERIGWDKEMGFSVYAKRL